MFAARTAIAGSMMTTAEVVQRHRQVNAGEVEIDALLGGDLKRHARLDHVLSRQGCARTDGVLVRQANLQRVADLRAGLGVRVVVVAGDVADEVQLLMQDAQSFARDCGGVSRVFAMS